MDSAQAVARRNFLRSSLLIAGPAVALPFEFSSEVSAATVSRTEINVLDFGATGDGLKDDTAAIKAAIAAAGQENTVWFPAGTYVISETLVVANNAVNLRGVGVHASRLRLIADAAESVAVRFERVGGAIYNCSMKNLSIVAETVNGVGLQIVDQSQFVLEDVLIRADVGNSRGVIFLGRENATVHRVYLRAFYPLYIGQNPNTNGGWLSGDHFHISDTYLRALQVDGSACVYIEDGAHLSNFTINGRNAWVGGAYGLLNRDTSSSIVSFQMNISNVRREQSMPGANWAIYVERSGGATGRLQGLTISNWYGDVRCNGFYLRGVDSVQISNTNNPAIAPQVALDVDDLNEMQWTGYQLQQAALLKLGSMNLVSASPIASNRTYPSTAFYNKFSLPYQQRPVSLFQASKWAHTTTLEPNGRLQIPINSTNGVRVALISVGAVSAAAGVLEAGQWVAGISANATNGVRLVCGTDGCSVSRGANRLTVYSAAQAISGPVYVQNTFGVACEIVVEATFKS